MNGDAFLAYVEQILALPLKPDDIVGMDNLRSPLPPYSPDFNPIEQLFAKLKTALRKSAAARPSPRFPRLRIAIVLVR
jgi:transposase